MNKTFLIILLATFTINVNAQENQKSILWEVSGNGLEKPSYIFGTIHIIGEDDYFFSDIMKEKLLSCNTLALEVDINMSIKKQLSFVKKIMLPKGKTLADYMTETQYKKYSTYILDSLKIKKKKFKQLNKIKPLFGQSIILSELLGKTKQYEKELSKIAKKNKIELIGLETIDYQINVLNKISIEKQVEMVASDDLFESNPLDEFNKMVKIYKEQDINKFSELFKEEKSMTEFVDDLLYNRNNNWIPIIEKQMKNNSIFVAVGAAHLPGEKGVLNLLKKAGYTVKPIK